MLIECETEDGNWVTGPTFSGENLDEWISAMEFFLNQFQIQVEQQAYFASHYVIGGARNWVESKINLISWMSWSMFVEQISVEFGESQAVAAEAIQLPNEEESQFQKEESAVVEVTQNKETARVTVCKLAEETRSTMWEQHCEKFLVSLFNPIAEDVCYLFGVRNWWVNYQYWLFEWNSRRSRSRICRFRTKGISMLQYGHIGHIQQLSSKLLDKDGVTDVTRLYTYSLHEQQILAEMKLLIYVPCGDCNQQLRNYQRKVIDFICGVNFTNGLCFGIQWADVKLSIAYWQSREVLVFEIFGLTTAYTVLFVSWISINPISKAAHIMVINEGYNLASVFEAMLTRDLNNFLHKTSLVVSLQIFMLKWSYGRGFRAKYKQSKLLSVKEEWDSASSSVDHSNCSTSKAIHQLKEVFDHQHLSLLQAGYQVHEMTSVDIRSQKKHAIMEAKDLRVSLLCGGACVVPFINIIDGNIYNGVFIGDADSNICVSLMCSGFPVMVIQVIGTWVFDPGARCIMTTKFIVCLLKFILQGSPSLQSLLTKTSVRLFIWIHDQGHLTHGKMPTFRKLLVSWCRLKAHPLISSGLDQGTFIFSLRGTTTEVVLIMLIPDVGNVKKNIWEAIDSLGHVNVATEEIITAFRLTSDDVVVVNGAKGDILVTKRAGLTCVVASSVYSSKLLTVIAMFFIRNLGSYCTKADQTGGGNCGRKFRLTLASCVVCSVL